MNSKTIVRVMLLVVVALLGFAYFRYDLQQYFALSYIKASQKTFNSYDRDHRARSICLYLLIYVVSTTHTEANKYVAGVWKKSHAPRKLLSYVERFHSFRRHSPKKSVRR